MPEKIDFLYRKQLENPSEKLGLLSPIKYHSNLWLYHTFHTKDYTKSRQHAAIVALCADCIDNKSDLVSGSFHVLKRPIFLLLMSDWDYIYNKFKSWDIPYGLPSKSYGRVWGERVMLYYILKEDYETLLKDYNYALGIGGKIKWHKRYAPYLAIMNKDKDALVKACLDLCTNDYHEEMKEYIGFTQELYHTLPTAALKLAWILGMEVEINNPYIPMELIPVKPLKEYHIPYFYLDGYKGQIPKGYKEVQKQNVDAKKAKQIDPNQYWKNFLDRNTSFKFDTSGEKKTIQYINEKGDTMLGEFTKPQICQSFLLVVFHHGFETWKKIPKNWIWDKQTYTSRKEAFFVETYKEYGYKVIKNKTSGYDVYWCN